jgi:hypothetical protein
MPTIKSEYAEAVTGSMRNRYTRMGIDRIEPPPPSKPRIRPMPTDATYPMISINKKYTPPVCAQRTVIF